jgi:hypothetical protein
MPPTYESYRAGQVQGGYSTPPLSRAEYENELNISTLTPVEETLKKAISADDEKKRQEAIYTANQADLNPHLSGLDSGDAIAVEAQRLMRVGKYTPENQKLLQQATQYLSLPTDQQKQQQAQSEQETLLRNQQVAQANARARAEQNVTSPLTAQLATKIDRGGFAAGVGGQGEAIQQYAGEVAGRDPEVTRMNALVMQGQAELEKLAISAKERGITDFYNAALKQQEGLKEAATKLADLKSQALKDSTQKAFDFIKEIDSGAIASMDPKALGSLFTQAGLNPLLAAGVQQSAQAITEAAKKKDEVAQAQAEANYQKTLADISQIGVEKDTPSMQDFAYYSKLKSTNPALAEEFAKFKGFGAEQGKFSTVTVGTDVYRLNQTTGQIEKVVGSEGATTILPTGEIITSNIGGRSVTLDSGAMTALTLANAAANQAGIGDIMVAQSTRDQKQTILEMAAKYSVDVDPSSLDSVNNAAAKITALGHPVAAVGKSLHEKGMAIDILDNTKDHAYLNKVKPYLLKNGWAQDGGPNDPGHFSFKGVVADPNQKTIDAWADRINQGQAKLSDITGAANVGIKNKVVQKLDEIAGGKLSAVQSNIKEATVLVGELIKHPGRTATTGVPSIVTNPFGLSLPSSDARDFKAKVERLNALLFLNAIPQMRGMGQLTEREGAKLEASSSITKEFGIDDNSYLKELNRLKTNLKSAYANLGGATALIDPEQAISQYGTATQSIGNEFGLEF